MVRKAKAEDCARIAEIIVFGKRVAYRPIFNNDEVSFNELQVIKLYQELQNESEMVKDMYVYDDGIVKGVIRKKDYGDRLEICEFYVEPFFKGNGIGRKLIQAVIDEAKVQNKKQIFLWVIKDNFSARKFYEVNGFCASGKEQIIEGTTKLDMCYEFNL